MPTVDLLIAIGFFCLTLIILLVILLFKSGRTNSKLISENLNLKSEIDTANRLLAEKEAASNRLIAEKEVACEELIRRSEESCQRLLKEQFANLAAQTLGDRQRDLSAHNAQQMDAILRPLREQMAQLQELTNMARSENACLGQTMSDDVCAIGKIAKELSGVASALSSDIRVQGRKGEEILAEKLRQAGLEENVNFFLQTGIESDRPDAQVCDTENRWLLIDSKVSLTSYIEYCEAKDEKEKAAKLAAHVASVKGKIDQLAKRKYPVVFQEKFKERNYLPVTAMFVPYEAPLQEALKAEPALWQLAIENNVVLVTPMTLLAYLRLVYLAWQHEKELSNQREIVSTARELLYRMNTFLMAYEKMGSALESLQEQYAYTRNLLTDAPNAHSIAKSAKKLIALEVKLEGKKGKPQEIAECLKEETTEA